jgi:hypothetical protein
VTESVAALEHLCQCLEELAEVSDQVHGAILADDYLRIRDLVSHSRKLHSTLGDANREADSVDMPGSVEAIDLLMRMQKYTQRISKADEALKGWLNRPAPPDSELIKTKEGVVRMVDVLLQEAWDPERDLIVLVGRGGAPVCDEFGARKQKRLVVYLPDDLKDDALPSWAVVAHTMLELANAVQNLPGSILPDRAITKKLPDDALDDALVQKVSDAVRDTLGDVRVGRNTMDAFGETWIAQGIANLPCIASWPSITALRGSFHQKPCVIVAAGPSLDKNIHLLKDLKGKVLIISVNRALAGLHAAGITPDVVMALDPLDLRYHFKGVPVDKLDALVLGATVHNDFFQLPVGRIFSFAGNNTLEDWIYGCLGDDARLPSGGSVACSALSLAVLWECDPILFVGLDLSFSGGQYYVSNTADGNTRVKISADGKMYSTEGFSEDLAKLPTGGGAKNTSGERVMEAAGYYGGTVSTSFMFHLFIRWFEEAVKAYAKKAHFVNCTEGGVFLAGMEHLSLREALSRYAAEPVDVAAILEAGIQRTDRRDRCQKMQKRIEEMLTALDRCAEKASALKQLCDRAAANEALLPAVEVAEVELVQALQPVLFISLLRQKEIRQAQEKAHQAETVAENLELEKRLFDVIETAAELLRPKLVHSLETLRGMLSRPA